MFEVFAKAADSDGLLDGVEVVLGTDPLNPDSDGDTVPDGAEVDVFATDPLVDERGCADLIWAETDLTTGAVGAFSVFATDLDGDGDADVLSAPFPDDRIAWHENLGGGTFGPTTDITTGANGAVSVYATDLDGDGDAEVLSASWQDDRIT